METGVGKTATRLPKQELVADFARNFVARRKKLVEVSQEADSNNHHVEKQNHWDCEGSKLEEAELGLETSPREQEKRKPESDSSNRLKAKGMSGSLTSSERKRKVSDVDKISMGFSCYFGEEEEEEEEFEPPTMSFEAYLTYDQPLTKKKKKKAVKRSVSAGDKDRGHSRRNASKAPTNSSGSTRKSPSHKRTSEKRAAKEPPEAPQPKRILLDVVPTLPDIPLPPIPASYSPLPSVEPLTCCQRKRKAVALPVEDSEAGFGGRRLNSKTPVCSGSKTARVPKTTSPSQQTLRVLSNNTDSICEVGSVPFSVLEPVLERCTPEQLYRVEERHRVLTDSTDQLWHRRCLRDFKNEKPEGCESWREMYLRLYKAREQRLLMLARNISSAHANKPKGRVAKIVFVDSTPKPPRDVRRRQEKSGTGGALGPEKAKIKPALLTSGKSHTRVSEEQSCEGPSTSSARSVPSSGGTFSSCDRRKPPVKRMAPLMAKALKDFRKRFSRR